MEKCCRRLMVRMTEKRSFIKNVQTVLEVTAKTISTFLSPLCWFSGEGGGSRNVNILCQKMEDKFFLAHMW